MEIKKLEEIIQKIFGDDLEFELTQDGNRINLKMLEEEQIGLVIGKGGRNIKALRELVYLFNKLHDTHFILELEEPEEE